LLSTSPAMSVNTMNQDIMLFDSNLLSNSMHAACHVHQHCHALQRQPRRQESFSFHYYTVNYPTHCAAFGTVSTHLRRIVLFGNLSMRTALYICWNGGPWNVVRDRDRLTVRALWHLGAMAHLADSSRARESWH